MTEYKDSTLQRLEDWLHDSMDTAEITPQEIYDVIKKVVNENYHYHKDLTGRAYELLTLLNGNGKGHTSCDKDDPSPECRNAWTSFWGEEDKVVKWQLPVEMDPSGECYVTFPDDLLEAANLNEGDNVEWVDNGDGSYTLKKITEPSWIQGNELAKEKTYGEMIALGYTMTDDGFWIMEL